MEYTVILNGKSYDLPPYTIRTSMELEEIEKKKANSNSVQASFNIMYSFIVKILGRENAVEAIGKIEEADPNMINLAYLSIVDSYNKPLNDFNAARQAKMIPPEFSKLVGDLSKAGNIINYKK